MDSYYLDDSKIIDIWVKMIREDWNFYGVGLG